MLSSGPLVRAHMGSRRVILSLGAILTHWHGVIVDETFLYLMG